jgi:phosphomannomutase
MRIAIDAGNGMAGIIAPAVFEGLPVGIEPLYFHPDGRFPHHPASPIEPANMADLQKLVRDTKPSLGAAFDGDADRVFLTDERGTILDGSIVTLIVARALLRKNPGATILYNVAVSNSVPELVAEMGGHAVRTRVGHSFIKAQMRETNAIFGGEHSGHFFFRDNWYADSGIIALLTVLEEMAEAGKSISELVKGLDRYTRSGEINSQVEDIPAKLAEIKREYGDGTIDELDGVTVRYPQWWFIVRPSNTEPELRLNVEADDAALMARKRDELLALIRAPVASRAGR